MFDAFDAFAALLLPDPPTGRRKPTFREALVWGLASILFPILAFALVMAAGEGTPTLTWVLPAAFAVTTYALAARFRTGAGLRIAATIICALFSLAAAFIGLMLATFPF